MNQFKIKVSNALFSLGFSFASTTECSPNLLKADFCIYARPVSPDTTHNGVRLARLFFTSLADDEGVCVSYQLSERSVDSLEATATLKALLDAMDVMMNDDIKAAFKDLHGEEIARIKEKCADVRNELIESGYIELNETDALKLAKKLASTIKNKQNESGAKKIMGCYTLIKLDKVGDRKSVKLIAKRGKTTAFEGDAGRTITQSDAACKLVGYYYNAEESASIYLN